MVLIDERDIKRHKFYMMYVVCAPPHYKKELHFFKYMKPFGTDRIEVVNYGHLYTANANRAILSNFDQHRGTLPLTGEDQIVTVYEITFDEFARHVVVETI